MRFTQFPTFNLLLFWGFVNLLCFKANGQNPHQLSPKEIHTLVEKHINYSRDSSLKLLDLASKQIEFETNTQVAKELKAENNLRRADYWTFNNLNSAQWFLNKSFDYYSANPDHKRLADIYVLKAQITRMINGKDACILYEALPYFDSALFHAEHYKDPSFLSFIYYEKAITLQHMERWEDSFENSLLATKYAETAKDSLNIATAYFLMGRTYHHFGLFRSSEEYISKSIEYAKGMAQQYSIIHIYADVLLQNNSPLLAKANYEKALKIALDKNDLKKATTLYTNIGQIDLNQKNFEGAKDCFTKINEILGSKYEAGYKTLLFIAQMHYYLGDRFQAKDDLQLFKTRYSDGKIIPRTIDVYKEAADLHVALNQTDQATLYYKKWGQLKDSLYSYTSKQQLNALEVMYLKELKKNEEILQKNTEIVFKNNELKESRQYQATMGGLLILVILIGGGLVYFIRMKGLKENQALKFSLKEKQMEQMIDAQENERQRLARELHDGIGQSLAALKMQLQFDKNPKAIDTTVQRIDIICDEVRSLSHQMMPLVLKENGLESAIEQLVEHNFSASPIKVDFVCSGLERRLPSNIEVNVYRIIQELVSNILRHSKASEVGIQLLKRGKKLVLIVEDDGLGFNPTNKADGIGLNNISVRLEALGGNAQIQSSAGEGTYIHISIPLFSEVNKQTA